ncbi:MAG: PDZ domain-containing protein [Planctomycetota bacterium]
MTRGMTILAEVADAGRLLGATLLCATLLCATLLCATLLCVLGGPTANAQVNEEPSEAALLAIAERLSDSFVVVEYTPQMDKGELPSAYRAGRGEDWPGLLEEERPAEYAGYLIGEDRVVTGDRLVHPRFIARIAVRKGEEVVDATIDAYGLDRNVLFLRLMTPLRKGRPLVFDPSRSGPYRVADFDDEDGTWRVHVRKLAQELPMVALEPGGTAEVRLPEPGLYVDSGGVPVVLVAKRAYAVGEDWRLPPDKWPVLAASPLAGLLGRLDDVAGKGLLRTNLRFRSPRTSDSGDFGRRVFYSGDDSQDEEITEWHGTSLLLDEHTVLVLANLRPKVTARLESVLVFPLEGEPVAASFTGTLTDYGGFLARLERPLAGALRLEERGIQEFEDELLLAAQIRVMGETRVAHFDRQRILSFSLGWRRQVYPDVEAASGDRGAPPWEQDSVASLNFLFTRELGLLGVPLPHRAKVATGQGGRSWRYSDAARSVLASTYLAAALRTGETVIDSENRPLREAEENRLAWLGVELQPMDPELARMNRIADQTRGGSTGAMVTFIYPNSPASEAGLQVGDVLLRLHIEGQPQPFEVVLQDGDSFGFPADFWEDIEGIPDEFLERMPKPWGSAENALTRALTDVGFGKHFRAEIFRDGKVFEQDFVVTEGPPHFDAAKRFESKAAGLTVRNLTYEVRRYYQLGPEDPGLIISKIEPGLPAAVAGLVPNELILAVNDQPLSDVDRLRDTLAPGGEFRLNVKRMTVGRLVTLKVEAESEKE